ncbi:DUF1254 domain-containing protein [Paraburkholderia silviterrae]|nr:DUF1254 domain-containing protein [Paraburkholderia silviterrae]
MYTFNFAYAGTRTTGNQAANFLLAGPNWPDKAMLDGQWHAPQLQKAH